MTRTTTNTAEATTHHQALGRYGERVAARHLIELGMVVLARNWRCLDGEADLVLRDGDTLVLCEVKTRSNHDHGAPHEAVTAEKVARMGRVAAAWAAAHGVRPAGTRLDLVAVVRPRKGASVVEHVKGLG